MKTMEIRTDSVDTSSIIERKEVTKEYWKKRMMADQTILTEDLLKDNTSTTKLNQCKMNSDSNEERNYGSIRKLGSDGESEASPESSLSPVEVDSLEEAGSDGRQSIEATDCEALLDSLICEEQQKQQSFQEIGDCEKDVKHSEHKLVNSEEEQCFLSCSEKEEKIGVIEEEQEPDSLEEFIKHENECMKEDTLQDILITFENSETVNENEYEEIGGQKNDDSPSVRDHQTLITDMCAQQMLTVHQNLIDFEVDTCAHESEIANNIQVEIRCDFLAIESVSKESSMGIFASNGVPDELTFEEKRNVIDESALLDGLQLRNEADTICKQKDICKPHIIGQTYQHLSDGTSNIKQLPETAKPDNVNEKEIILKNTENKIAEEIREQKLREEELRRMREDIKMKQSSLVDSNSSKSSLSNVSVNGQNGGRISPAVSEMSLASSSAVSSDSLDNYSIRSSDRVKVKPFVCDTDDYSIAYKVLSESPIEKEIRISKEREEALRLEKSRILKCNEINDSLKKSASSTSIKSPVLRSLSTGSTNAGNIQKVLATTRIQQEIEEQTQREIELREKGSIKTISQERTDIKVTILGEIEKITKQAPVSPVTINGDHKTQPVCSAPKESPVRNSNPVKRKISLPQIFGFGAAKNISMHKFISSKGKTSSLNPSFTSFVSNGNDFHHLKPPQILKGEKGIRRVIPAESKIQEELKEMKAREEELKWQRARLIGKSQPNLATLEKQIDKQCSEEEEKCSVTGISANLLKRTASIPNIIDDDVKNAQVCQFGVTKKRNPLIEQWELKIQKFIKMKK